MDDMNSPAVWACAVAIWIATALGYVYEPIGFAIVAILGLLGLVCIVTLVGMLAITLWQLPRELERSKADRLEMERRHRENERRGAEL